VFTLDRLLRMIVRDRPTGFNLFLILRGSVLQRIRWVLCLNIVLAVLVTYAHGNLFDLKITVTPIPFTLIGLPLAIFLGFRNTTAYNRFWEGRKLWGELVICARTLSRQCQNFIRVPLVLDPATAWRCAGAHGAPCHCPRPCTALPTARSPGRWRAGALADGRGMVCHAQPPAEFPLRCADAGQRP
jgi:predicted membrane chloride channel (bestrophin family)